MTNRIVVLLIISLLSVTAAHAEVVSGEEFTRARVNDVARWELSDQAVPGEVLEGRLTLVEGVAFDSVELIATGGEIVELSRELDSHGRVNTITFSLAVGPEGASHSVVSVMLHQEAGQKPLIRAKRVHVDGVRDGSVLTDELVLMQVEHSGS